MSEVASPELARRRYESAVRRDSAAQTRNAILHAARALFVEQGYSTTTMTNIAERAGVAVDTIYSTIGPKPQLLGELVTEALNRENGAASSLEESKHKEDPATSATDLSRSYAEAVGRFHFDVGPLFSSLRASDPWSNWLRGRSRRIEGLPTEIARRHLQHAHVDLKEVADEIWALSSIEVYELLVNARGWSHERYVAWLGSAINRLLVA